MAIQIQLRHDTAANWTSVNPILALGERGVETDTGKEKSGDGVTAWNSLSYFGGTGSVTTISVVSANGLAGTVANATTTPAITLSTSITGILKGNGTAFSAAAIGTDYSAGTSALTTGILKSTTSTGALSIAVASDFPTLNQNTTGTAANVTGIVAIANGGTGATSLAGANIDVINAASNFTGTKTFSGTSSTLAAIFTNAAEVTTISATAATGTIAFYTATQSVLYNTVAATANWTVNLTHSVGTTFNTAMAIGQCITVTHLVTQGATAYYNSAVQVDGTTTGVTTKWQGGTAPTAGDASAIDVYTYAIIKTAASTFTVLAAVSKFA